MLPVRIPIIGTCWHGFWWKWSSAVKRRRCKRNGRCRYLGHSCVGVVLSSLPYIVVITVLLAKTFARIRAVAYTEHPVTRTIVCRRAEGKGKEGEEDGRGGQRHGALFRLEHTRLHRAPRRRRLRQQNGGQGRAPPCSVGAGGAAGAVGACVEVAAVFTCMTSLDNRFSTVLR